MIHDLHMGLVAEVVIKTALASGITLGALRIMANRTAGERSFVAHLGLAATLAIPLAALVIPVWSLGDAFAWLCEITAPWWTYAAPAIVLGIMTGVAVARLAAVRKRATVLIEPAWLGALAHAQRRMGFKSGAALLVSPDVVSPVSWGLFRPTIVLNERALQAHGEAEAIIAHELAHVVRADWAKLLLARAATALFWFNPLVWLLARTCHELREEAADDAVLWHEVDRSDYAAILVGHARHECRGAFLAANSVAPGRGSLARRVRRVLDGTMGRAPAGHKFAFAVLMTATTIGAPLAALTLRAPAPAVAQQIAPPRATDVAAPVMVAADPQDDEPVALVDPHFPAAPHDPIAATGKMENGVVMSATAPATLPQGAPSTPSFTPGELVAISTHGVTPEWLREMAALGYTDLTGSKIAALAVHGIGPDDVRAMAAAGYPRLSAGQLIALRVQGVTPDYVREITRTGRPRPSPEELVQLSMRGVSADLVRAAAEARSRANEARAEVDQAMREKRHHNAWPPIVAPPHPPHPPTPARPPAGDDD